MRSSSDIGISRGRTEEGYAREIRELMERKHIKKTDEYLSFLQGQKELKRNAAKKKMDEAEWEIGVIEKMRRGEL